MKLVETLNRIPNFFYISPEQVYSITSLFAIIFILGGILTLFLMLREHLKE